MNINRITTLPELKTAILRHWTLLAILLAAFGIDCATAQTNIPATAEADSGEAQVKQSSDAPVLIDHAVSCIAAFDVFDPSGCIYENVFLSAIKGFGIDAGSGSSTRWNTQVAPITIQEADLCAGWLTLVAYGTADASGMDFWADAELKSARLQFHFELFDMIQFELVPLDATVEFTGVGELLKDHVVTKTDVPGGVQIAETTFESRAATAVGYFTVFDPLTGETNKFPMLTPCTSIFAELDRGSMTVITTSQTQTQAGK